MQEKGCPEQGALAGQTLGERKQCMEQEENLGLKIIDIRDTKREKEVEKSFKKGTGEGQLQAGFHSTLWRERIPCKHTEL